MRGRPGTCAACELPGRSVVALARHLGAGRTVASASERWGLSRRVLYKHAHECLGVQLRRGARPGRRKRKAERQRHWADSNTLFFAGRTPYPRKDRPQDQSSPEILSRERIRIEGPVGLRRRAKALRGNGAGPTVDSVLLTSLLRGLSALEREASPARVPDDENTGLRRPVRRSSKPWESGERVLGTLDT